MKKDILICLGFALFLLACTKEEPVRRPHEFAAEQASQSAYEEVIISISSDYKLTCSKEGMSSEPLSGYNLYSFGKLRIVCGECSDINELMEKTFWKESSALWIYALTLDSKARALENMGFADCFRYFLSEDSESGRFVYAGSNVFDSMSDFTRQGEVVSFNVRLKME